MRSILSALTLAVPLVAGALIAAGVRAGGEPESVAEADAPARVAASRRPRPVATAAPRREPRPGELLVLAAPTLADWVPEPEAPTPPATGEAPDALVATAVHFDAQVFARPGSDPKVKGVVRRGEVLPVAAPTTGRGCPGGRWYVVEGDGVVCTSRGFNVGDAPLEIDQRTAAANQPLPYRFAQVTTPDAPRFYRIPTPEEESRARAAIAAGEAAGDVVERVMSGDYYLAIDRIERDGGRSFYRTVRGRYVSAADVEVVPAPGMRGERLGEGEVQLPLAVVYGAPEHPLFRLDGEEVREVGVARKHARFPVAREVETDRGALVVGPDGIAVARDAVRVIRAIERPRRISEDTRWIHVDLAEQTLVAYEGDAPVFATLVSSGKEGYDTPRGTFRVRLKYLSTTMSGDDPIDGFYEVEEVPWTMYYFEGYALHGAYWHDDFGKVRSHGCTNIAPADARWLYYWAAPEVPAGWHGRRKRTGGTHLHFTR